jgi:hypothetical protein
MESAFIDDTIHLFETDTLLFKMLSAVLRSSLDGFTTNLDTLSQSSSYTNNVADLTALAPVSGTVEFRIYFYNTSAIYAANPQYSNMFLVNSSSGRTGDSYDSLQGFYNVGLSGVEAIPEPETLTMLGVGVGALLLLRRRQDRDRRGAAASLALRAWAARV